MPNFSREQFRSTFEFLSKSSVKGIYGVHKLGRYRNGKNLLLTMFTHGNEPSGLAAAHRLLSDIHLQKRLKGNVYIVINNLRAATHYFQAKTAHQKLACRYFDIDMNRLPQNALEIQAHSYELQRLHELSPVYTIADVGIDMHSFPCRAAPMIIDIKGEEQLLNNLSNGIPIPLRITNIAAIQVGCPIGLFYGGLGKNIPVIEVETGLHEKLSSFQRAAALIIPILTAAGFLELECMEYRKIQIIRRAIGVVKFPNISYKLHRSYPAFSLIRARDVIATGDGPQIIATKDCSVLFPRKGLSVCSDKKLQNEIMTLTNPPKRRWRILRIPNE